MTEAESIHDKNDLSTHNKLIIHVVKMTVSHERTNNKLISESHGIIHALLSFNHFALCINPHAKQK